MSTLEQKMRVAVTAAAAAAMAACGAAENDAEPIDRVQTLLPTIAVERVSSVAMSGPIERRVRVDVRGLSDMLAERPRIDAVGDALFEAADEDDDTVSNPSDDGSVDSSADTANDGIDDGIDDDDVSAAPYVFVGAAAGEACTSGFDCADLVCFSAGHVVDSAPGSCSSPEGLRLAPGACYDDADCGGAHCDPSGVASIGNSMIVNGPCITDYTFYPGTCTASFPQ